MVPSGTMKDSPKAGGFQVFPAQQSLDPVYEVHGIFSNMHLASTCLAATKNNSISLQCLGSLFEKHDQ